jgi:peptide/nickel transport system permease protein
MGVWERYRRSRRAVVALGVLLLTFSLALAAPLVTAYDPLAGSADALLPPLAPGHPLGTDHLGRDVWSQLVYGARVSLAVGLLAALSATLLGTAVGAAAGYAGGWPDGALMRLAEFFQTLPRLVLALIVVALFGAGVGRLIFVIAILSWPQTARVVRASVLSLREAPFVDAARVGGMGAGAIVASEILPNALAPIVVTGSLDVATAILLEAALGFFGLGDPNRVSWGSMLNQAQPYLRQAWWMAVFPGLAISFVVLSFNVVGDSLNEALNPRLRGAR